MEVVSFFSVQAVESVEEEEESYLLCKARLDHLKSYASGEQTEGMKNAWRQTRIDRMLVDHFLRAGYYTAAQKLTESSGIEVRRATNSVNRRMGGCPPLHAGIGNRVGTRLLLGNPVTFQPCQVTDVSECLHA